MTGKHHAESSSGGRPSFTEVDFDKSPFIVFWEVTRACALSCLHCRAEAQPQRHPQELSTEEGFRLIDEVASFGSPLFVITGGDPMMRRDLYDFIEYGTEKGLRVSLAPSATKLVTEASLARAKVAGLARISISLDGPTPETHDAFRQTPGSFERTMAVIEAAKAAKLSFQINTTVSRYSLHHLEAMATLISNFGVAMWSVFFLVPTGRGKNDDMISPQEHEMVFNWLYDFSKQVPFDVKTTAAEHYRRVVIQREHAASIGSPQPTQDGASSIQLNAPGFSYADGIGRAPKGVNDGRGCVFVSHIGEVQPSGFLPVAGGNIREKGLVEIYRNSTLFRDLRDTSKLKGKCGLCEFNEVCGGSRARAYAVTGDYLEAELYCVYQSAGVESSVTSS